jgi:hypothetical protein
MQTPSLTAYRFTVAMGDPDDPTFLEVTAFGRDIQKVEALFAERKWGSAQDRPMTAAVAAAYFAAVRTGKYDGEYDAFDAAYLEVVASDPVKVGPTERAPVPA